MQLRLGRPAISAYRAMFDLPVSAGAERPSVMFLGVSTLLLDDGVTSIMTDGFFSRPGLARVATRRIAPDPGRVDRALRRAGADTLAAVFPVHTHYDHAMDSAVVAERTGAVLVGGASAASVGRGRQLPEHRLRVVSSGTANDFGSWRVTHVESRHCPPDRYPGVIAGPVEPPVRASAYRCGEAWSILFDHLPTGRSLLVQGSAGFVPGSLADVRAEVVYLGVGQLGLQPDAYIAHYWGEVVAAVGARQVVLIHWDDFFRSLEHPLRALPYLGDDLHRTMRVLQPLAARDRVGIHFPSVWRREDPWLVTGSVPSAR